MRSEVEIREKIESINKEDKELQKDYREDKIPRIVVSSKLLENSARRLTLRWVLDDKVTELSEEE